MSFYLGKVRCACCFVQQAFGRHNVLALLALCFESCTMSELPGPISAVLKLAWHVCGYVLILMRWPDCCCVAPGTDEAPLITATCCGSRSWLTEAMLMLH